jgi:hypothetical protein
MSDNQQRVKNMLADRYRFTGIDQLNAALDVRVEALYALLEQRFSDGELSPAVYENHMLAFDELNRNEILITWFEKYFPR